MDSEKINHHYLASLLCEVFRTYTKKLTLYVFAKFCLIGSSVVMKQLSPQINNIKLAEESFTFNPCFV